MRALGPLALHDAVRDALYASDSPMTEDRRTMVKHRLLELGLPLSLDSSGGVEVSFRRLARAYIFCDVHAEDAEQLAVFGAELWKILSAVKQAFAEDRREEE